MNVYYALYHLTSCLRKNDLFNTISNNLIKHRDDLMDIKIDKLAEKCSTSTATITRYLKELGFVNYKIFVKALGSMKDSFLTGSSLMGTRKQNSQESLMELKSLMDNSLKSMYLVNTSDLYDKAVDLMLGSKKVIFVGLPIIQNTIFLRMELEELGIETTSYVNPIDQFNELTTLDEDTTVFFTNISEGEAAFPKLKQFCSVSNRLITISVSGFKRVENDDSKCHFLLSRNAMSVNQIMASIVIENLIAIIQNR